MNVFLFSKRPSICIHYNMLSLYNASVGKQYKIIKINEIKDKLRLIELGFIGCFVKVKAVGIGKGVFLLSLRRFDIILSASLCKEIMVE